MYRSTTLALLVGLGLAACTDATIPVESASTLRAPDGPAATIWDGAHAAIGSKFFFLPPMVKNPKDDKKATDGTLSPVVEVCELTSGNVCGRLIDRYSATGGGKTNENVRWLGNHYHVNFHAKSYTLDVTKRLRVTVFVDSVTLGWADVIVGRSAKDFNGVDPEQFVTITDKQTLPIKFRIGYGIAKAIAVTPPLDSVFAGETTTYAAVVTDLHNQPLAATVTWTSSNPAVATVNAAGVVTTHTPGTVTITASAEGLSASATLVVLPRVVRVEVNSVTMDIGNRVGMVATAYDQFGNVVLGEEITWTIQNEDGSIVSITSLSGEVTGLMEGVADVTATIAGVSGSGTATVTSDLELPQICNGDGLQYLGSTTIIPVGECGIRITPSDMWTAGSAWSNTKQPLAAGFEVRFGFRMSSPGPADFLVQGNTSPGADGITFVVQNMAADAVGQQGVGIGYQGMTSSLAVEFDTWLNPGENDPSGNHVSVHTNGIGANHASEAFSLGAVNIPNDFYDSQVHQVVINYVPGTLTVTLDGNLILTVAVTLTSIGGSSILDANGEAWVGFTSATGSAYGIHEILSWELHTP